MPRLRQRVVSNPLSIAPPRWEVDPNFDLDYHLRWTRAGGDGTLRDLLDMAQPIAMQGFDRARPLWEFTVVDGLADGRAALIIKIHHAITDGVGAIKIAMHLFDLERDAALDREVPRCARGPRDEPARAGASTRSQHERRRQLGMRPPVAPIGGAAGAAALRRDAAGASAGTREHCGAPWRGCSRPRPAPLSPLMTDRSLSVRFDTIVGAARRSMKAAARNGRTASSTTRSSPPSPAACAATTTATASRSTRLRMTMPINVRTTTPPTSPATSSRRRGSRCR